MRWNLHGVETRFKSYPFNVEGVELSNKDKDDHRFTYYRLQCPDWLNVLPITSNNQAILIRQPRAGTLTEILETPGGVVEPNERDTAMAALRELEEETGFTSQRILPLLAVNPNPALMTNRVHMFLALNCHIPDERKHFPDTEERITTELVPVEELEDLVRCGKINHSLSALCIMLALKYLKK